MRIITVIAGIVVTVCFFFAFIFAAASQSMPSRLLTSGVLFAIGLAIIIGIYYITKKPKTIIQQMELSGSMKAAQINCPNCGASINANEIKILTGVPYVKCPYCGTTFQVAEEPKW
jgi:predicted Zn finger-like uncharacterized protein